MGWLKHVRGMVKKHVQWKKSKNKENEQNIGIRKGRERGQEKSEREVEEGMTWMRREQYRKNKDITGSVSIRPVSISILWAFHKRYSSVKDRSWHC